VTGRLSKRLSVGVVMIMSSGRSTRYGGGGAEKEKCCILDFIEERAIAGFGVVVHFYFYSLQVKALLFQ